MIQRAKPKYTSCQLSPVNVNNRNEVGGLVSFKGYVCKHRVIRRTIIWLVRVTWSKSSMCFYPTWSAPAPTNLQTVSTFLSRFSSFVKMLIVIYKIFFSKSFDTTDVSIPIWNLVPKLNALYENYAKEGQPAYLKRYTRSANRIIGYYRIYVRKGKARMILYACAEWHESAHFAHVQKHFFLSLCLHYNTYMPVEHRSLTLDNFYL